MSEPAPALRLVQCEHCEQMRRGLESATVDLDDARRELAIAKRQISALRNAETKRRREGPTYEVAQQLFEFWQKECGHPRATFGPKREQAVLARLQDYTPRQIALAIRGARVAAYVDESGVRHDDLELICRNEVKLEKFIERYERWKEQQA